MSLNKNIIRETSKARVTQEEKNLHDLHLIYKYFDYSL